MENLELIKEYIEYKTGSVINDEYYDTINNRIEGIVTFIYHDKYKAYDINIDDYYNWLRRKKIEKIRK
jgi:hypothetical protein